MPLDTRKEQEIFRNISRQATTYRKYAAWYSGTPEQIRAVAENGSFWKASTCSRKLHVPLAADLATYSADLLFSETPSFEVIAADHSDAAQARLEAILKANDFTSKLNEAGETCSALGDVYLKINYDRNLLDLPIINVVQADCAWPEFQMGLLRAVNFLTTVATSGDSSHPTVYRLLERHEYGIIYSKLFQGGNNDLGKAVPFESIGMQAEAEQHTGIDDLLVVHVPNMLPNRRARGSGQGRSDYDSLLSEMDALDEAYSSWLRDVNLGKARLIVPAEYLKQYLPPGEQSNLVERGPVWHFDKEDDLYVALGIDAERLTDTGIVMSQFEIRSQQHLQTCQEFMERIIVTAGYSPQSFGLKIEGRADSGTALNIRERKSFITKAKKETYWKSRLEKYLSILLQVDNRVFQRGLAEGAVRVEFKDSVTYDTDRLAASVELLNRANAASTRTKVAMLHPDWVKEQVEAEVELIYRETGQMVPDPTRLDLPLDLR